MISFKGSIVSLRIIHKFLTYILKDHDYNLYLLDYHIKGKKQRVKSPNMIDISERTFDEPYVELFLYGIFSNKPDLIDFCWHRCGQPILMAVIAAAIYSKLGWFYRNQSKHYKILQKRKAVFVERANKVGL